MTADDIWQPVWGNKICLLSIFLPPVLVLLKLHLAMRCVAQGKLDRVMCHIISWTYLFQKMWGLSHEIFIRKEYCSTERWTDSKEWGRHWWKTNKMFVWAYEHIYVFQTSSSALLLSKNIFIFKNNNHTNIHIPTKAEQIHVIYKTACRVSNMIYERREIWKL